MNSSVLLHLNEVFLYLEQEGLDLKQESLLGARGLRPTGTAHFNHCVHRPNIAMVLYFRHLDAMNLDW